jgi:hypothetical protein
MLDGQVSVNLSILNIKFYFYLFKSIGQHPKLAPYITSVRNEQIALHFNDKLTPMEYILYNVAVVESDIYSNSMYIIGITNNSIMLLLLGLP